ncbi:MAG: hypothetical protein AUH32_07800 [Actinobacteria bacterium 13_1_40CM_66_12]|nr:MAG: hypothetical protein AUH32_07800 [Actinobacteria bacterium 13_1_40CM_66_12]
MPRSSNGTAIGATQAGARKGRMPLMLREMSVLPPVTSNSICFCLSRSYRCPGSSRISRAPVANAGQSELMTSSLLSTSG